MQTSCRKKPISERGERSQHQVAVLCKPGRANAPHTQQFLRRGGQHPHNFAKRPIVADHAGIVVPQLFCARALPLPHLLECGDFMLEKIVGRLRQRQRSRPSARKPCVLSRQTWSIILPCLMSHLNDVWLMQALLIVLHFYHLLVSGVGLTRRTHLSLPRVCQSVGLSPGRGLLGSFLSFAERRDEGLERVQEEIAERGALRGAESPAFLELRECGGRASDHLTQSAQLRYVVPSSLQLARLGRLDSSEGRKRLLLLLHQVVWPLRHEGKRMIVRYVLLLASHLHDARGSLRFDEDVLQLSAAQSRRAARGLPGCPRCAPFGGGGCWHVQTCQAKLRQYLLIPAHLLEPCELV
eukprot:scaffold252337_cov30-Tisochrysis_lutea.AAC.1